MERRSIGRARDELTRLVREAEAGRPVEITRRGRPVAVLVAADAFRRLTEARPGFSAALDRFREEHDLAAAGVDGSELDGVRDRAPGREVDL